MAINNGDILRVVASLVFPDDVIMQNVFHIVATTIVGDGAEEDITLDLVGYLDAIYAEHDANIADTVAGDEIKAYIRDTVDDDWDEIGTGSLTLVAADVNEMLPHGIALMQTFYTIDPDVQGRKYWGGFTENSQDAGNWEGALLTNIVLSAAEVIGTYVGTETGSTFQPIVWSPTRANVPENMNG